MSEEKKGGVGGGRSELVSNVRACNIKYYSFLKIRICGTPRDDFKRRMFVVQVAVCGVGSYQLTFPPPRFMSLGLASERDTIHSNFSSVQEWRNTASCSAQIYLAVRIFTRH